MSVDNETIWGIKEALEKIAGCLDWIPAINENIGNLCDQIEGIAALLDNRMPEIEPEGLTMEEAEAAGWLTRPADWIPQARKDLKYLGATWVDGISDEEFIEQASTDSAHWESYDDFRKSSLYRLYEDLARR